MQISSQLLGSQLGCERRRGRRRRRANAQNEPVSSFTSADYPPPPPLIMMMCCCWNTCDGCIVGWMNLNLRLPADSDRRRRHRRTGRVLRRMMVFVGHPSPLSLTFIPLLLVICFPLSSGLLLLYELGGDKILRRDSEAVQTADNICCQHTLLSTEQRRQP